MERKRNTCGLFGAWTVSKGQWWVIYGMYTCQHKHHILETLTAVPIAACPNKKFLTWCVQSFITWRHVGVLLSEVRHGMECFFFFFFKRGRWERESRGKETWRYNIQTEAFIFRHVTWGFYFYFFYFFWRVYMCPIRVSFTQNLSGTGLQVWHFFNLILWQH